MGRTGTKPGSPWRSTPQGKRGSPMATWTIPRELQDEVRAVAEAAGKKPSPWVTAALRVVLRHHQDEVLAELLGVPDDPTEKK